MKVACVKVKSVQQPHLLLCSNLIFPELMSASWKSLSREKVQCVRSDLQTRDTGVSAGTDTNMKQMNAKVR